MNPYIKRGVWLIIPAVFVITIFAIISSWSGETAVVADEPPPMLPAFDGTPYVTQLDNVKGLNLNPIPAPNMASDWTVIVSETFTTSLDASIWSSIDDNSDPNSGEYYWATGIYSNTGVTNTVARAISGGMDGTNITVTQGYPDNADSWLILGPFNTEGASEATITFDYWFQAALMDHFGIAVSTNGASYSGERKNGGVEGWQSVSYNLNDYVGAERVYVAFIFTSDASGNTQNNLGAYLDNVNLFLRYPQNTYLPLVQKYPTITPTSTPIATNTPTPSPTPTMASNYRDDFDDPDSGWEMRRTDMTNTSDWEVEYRDAGELELAVDKTSSYILVSPLVESVPPPYNIEVRARFTDQSEDRHLYSIVFGGNKDSDDCPHLPDFSTCFNRYYILRVEWDETTPGKPIMEYMLRRVYAHGGSNNPLSVDLIGWRSVGNNITMNSWHEWDINVDESGKMRISFDDVLVGTATDDTIIHQRYFGLVLETNSEGDARAKFDYFKVNAIDN